MDFLNNVFKIRADKAPSEGFQVYTTRFFAQFRKTQVYTTPFFVQTFRF